MTYWAQLDKDNKVLQVTVGDEDLETAYQWLIDNHGGRWVQTTLNNYAGIEWTYIENVGFYPPQPYASWILDGLTWKAPIDKPQGTFYWDESLVNWVKATVLNNGD